QTSTEISEKPSENASPAYTLSGTPPAISSGVYGNPLAPSSIRTRSSIDQEMPGTAARNPTYTTPAAVSRWITVTATSDPAIEAIHAVAPARTENSVAQV